MPRPNRSKKKPPIETSDEESIFTFSPPSPSPGLFRTGEKRGHLSNGQSSPEKENQKPAKKIIKPTTTTDRIPRNYIRSILAGEDLFTKEEMEKDVLKGLVEEVRALRKEVAPIKETYAKRLRKDLPFSSSLPPILSLLSTPSPSSRSPTSTRSKKKQL
ncbi:uncharacterized protein K441DRAFT_651321 [Cenococcum geophilum 1.58]|uniref:uncharacterized protein n=1 Tax=Cenococcum geophilum 1.58 TaxID=794803 RepID=UPI0035902C7A|nr:hypothetical protein K441DRAFT_651321 [Cenococcum geophilum 1.58]